MCLKALFNFKCLNVKKKCVTIHLSLKGKQLKLGKNVHEYITKTVLQNRKNKVLEICITENHVSPKLKFCLALMKKKKARLRCSVCNGVCISDINNELVCK